MSEPDAVGWTAGRALYLGSRILAEQAPGSMQMSGANLLSFPACQLRVIVR
jgi:hypothetical protein